MKKGQTRAQLGGLVTVVRRLLSSLSRLVGILIPSSSAVSDELLRPIEKSCMMLEDDLELGEAEAPNPIFLCWALEGDEEDEDEAESVDEDSDFFLRRRGGAPIKVSR